MQKKYCFVLLEVIIALALVAGAALFIARVPYLQIRHQRRCLMEMEMARLDRVYLQKLQVLLLQETIRSQDIERMQTSSVFFEDKLAAGPFIPPCDVKVVMKKKVSIVDDSSKKISKISIAILITPKIIKGKTYTFDHTLLIEKKEKQ